MTENRSLWHLMSRKAVRKLLETGEWPLDDTATARMYQLTNNPEFKIYVHADGSGLYVVGDGKGKLYPLVSDMYAFIEQQEKFTAEVRANPRGQHILKGRLPYQKEFVEHIPELIVQVSQQLRIQAELLDGTFASLKTVEVALKHTRRTKRLEPALFGPLVAYIGEVMRIYVKGRWEMRLSSQDKETWEPWIIDPEGRECNSWSYLYDMLAEQTPLSISSVASVGISTRSLPISKPPNPGTFAHLSIRLSDSKGNR